MPVVFSIHLELGFYLHLVRFSCFGFCPQYPWALPESLFFVYSSVHRLNTGPDRLCWIWPQHLELVWRLTLEGKCSCYHNTSTYPFSNRKLVYPGSVTLQGGLFPHNSWYCYSKRRIKSEYRYSSARVRAHYRHIHFIESTDHVSKLHENLISMSWHFLATFSVSVDISYLGSLLIGPLGTSCREIMNKIHTFHTRKLIWKRGS